MKKLQWLEAAIWRPEYRRPDVNAENVGAGRGKMVFVIDTTTNSVLHKVPVGQGPWGVIVLNP